LVIIYKSDQNIIICESIRHKLIYESDKVIITYKSNAIPYNINIYRYYILYNIVNLI
jgi:hypothetical protein